MKRTIALVLALVLCLALFAGCGSKQTASGSEEPAASGDKPLVVGYSNFSSKFSPFFSETAYDQDVWAMTAVNLLEENSCGIALVYPNPTNGQINVEAEGLKHIAISNMLGQQIFNGSANGDAFEYDFGQYGAGVYLVRIETSEGVATKRVVVTQ